MSHLLAWQRRVIDERDALAERAQRLQAFIGTAPFNGLPLPDQHLMVEQLRLMQDLGEILNRRIARFQGM